jgi:hypothetical protein
MKSKSLGSRLALGRPSFPEVVSASAQTTSTSAQASGTKAGLKRGLLDQNRL